MTSGRDPIDRVVDLVVGASSSMLKATRRSVPLLAEIGNRQLAKAADRVGTAVAARAESSADPGAGRSRAKRKAAPATGQRVPASRGVDDSSPAVGELALDDYDQLAARQIVARLDALSGSELSAIEAYERAHRHRATVIGRIEQLRS